MNKKSRILTMRDFEWTLMDSNIVLISDLLHPATAICAIAVENERGAYLQ